MLTGAVAGDIFSSPSVHHVLEAILAVTTHCKEETREKDAVLPPPPSSHGTSTVSNCNHSMLAETCIGSQATNAPQATDSRLTSCNNCLEYKRVEIGRCLVLCLNYTGDRLNFGLAADRAETMLRRLHAIKSSDSKSHKHESRVRPASLPAGSSDEDVVVDLGTSADSNDKRRFVEIVFVGDDASLSRDRISCSSGRRGLAGTILVIKAACAAAALGYSLEAVKRVAEIASRNVATVGLSFAPVQIPGAPLCQEFISRAEQFDNGHGMMELGMGIHGERGSSVESLVRYGVEVNWTPSDSEGRAAITYGHRCVSVHRIARCLVERVLCDSSSFGYLAHRRTNGQEVALLTNSLGSTSDIELALLCKACVDIVQSAPYNLLVSRCITGRLLTSLHMQGVSLSIMLLDGDKASDPGTMPSSSADCCIKYLLDFPASCTALPPIVNTECAPTSTAARDPRRQSFLSSDEVQQFLTEAGKSDRLLDANGGSVGSGGGAWLTSCDANRYRRVLKFVTGTLIRTCDAIGRLDTIAGDGDCGINVEKACNKIRATLLAEAASQDKHAQADTRQNESIVDLLQRTGRDINDASQGTIGVLHQILLEAFAASITRRADADATPSPRSRGGVLGEDEVRYYRELSQAFLEAVDRMSEVTGATEGMRSMVDSLRPAAIAMVDVLGDHNDSTYIHDNGSDIATACCGRVHNNHGYREGNNQGRVTKMIQTSLGLELEQGIDTMANHRLLPGVVLRGLACGADASLNGAEKTAQMEARVGRSSYIPADVLRGCPDPGATVVACWISAVAEYFMKLDGGK
eukprot:GHVQ01014223.1.p1 GENE.GHVQ01014223.1~~GHVQ01014223.1.p1  ORF type:complete len:806 (+),score=85.86 GHVQ01014223.1:552-2969(+)